jgi:MFS family permease
VTAAILALNARTFSSLRRHRNYRLYFLGQAVSQTGTWIDKIAQAWLVLALTHSPVAVGILAACQFVPFSVLGLVAGVVVDRLDNWRTVVWTQAVRMVIAATLAAIVLLGLVQVWMVYGLAVLMGIVLVLDAPSRQALTFRMVGRSELPNAVALNSSLFNAARIVGPGIGGVLIAGFGVGVAFAINAASFIAVLLGLLLMDSSRLVELDRPEERKPTLVHGLREGLAYARHSPHVRLVLTMLIAISTIAMNFNVLLPVLARQTLDSGPRVFGLIAACFGAGALAGGLASAALSRASWTAILAGAGGLGIADLVLAPQASLAPVALLLFVVGVSFSLFTANANARLQLTAPDHLRGRVISLYYVAFNALAPVGGLTTGWLVSRGGTALALSLAGGTAVTVTLLASARLVVARRRERRQALAPG